MRFIHISDVHLGVKPDTGRPWSEKRAREIWDTFAQVIETAERKQPDFLFITGDLFHAQPLKKELKEVNALFLRIPATKVLFLAGNHDYLRPSSYYLTFPWAENVYFFKREEAECFDFPALNTAVYGLSYWHREIREPLYDGLSPANKERINILLAHGGDDRHIPFRAQRILERGFDYLAAGHIHRGGWLVRGKAAMAGSLEPTDCNDTGMHGYWMGEIVGERVDVRFYPVRKCEYCHETYNVNPDTTEREITEWAKKLLAERPGYQYFRLFLKGKRDPETGFFLEEMMELPRIVDVTDNTVPDLDYGKLLEENPDSILGSYIRSMSGREQDEITKKALEYGVNALLGYEICR